MADSRIENLSDEVLLAELQSLKATLKIALDDPSYSAGDTKKMLLSTLLKSDILTDAEGSIDYQAMTPACFKATVATTNRLGVVEKATNSEVTAGSVDKFVDAAQLKSVKDAIEADIASSIIKGSYHVGDLNASQVNYTITHNAGTTSYIVALTVYNKGYTATAYAYGIEALKVVTKNSNNMVVQVHKTNNINMDLYIDWVIYKI
jgi:hypothetical protein